MFRHSLVPLSFLLCGLPVIAAQNQADRAAAAHARHLKPLQVFEGRWLGGGSVEFAPGQKQAFTSSEQVELKLDGTLLLIEGIHHARFPGAAADVKIHHGLAVVSYDAGSQTLRFRAYKSDGNTVDSEARWENGTLIWGFDDPRLGRTRYRLSVNEAGEWIEIGEREVDGKWTQFLEMKLERVQ